MSTYTISPKTPAPTQETSRRRYIPYLVFTLCASLYLLPFMRLLLEETDEGTLIVGAVRIVHGQVFARDFFEVVGPGTFYWLALFFKLFGVSFMATRICLFVTSLGTVILIYFLSRRVCRRYQALPCILVFATYFGGTWRTWPMISHHTDSNFFALLAFTCLVLWEDSRKSSLLLAAGALAGATTCFLQPKGMLLLLAFLVWLWIQHRRRSVSLSAVVLMLGGYFSVVSSMLLYFWSRGGLNDLLYANVVWPFSHYWATNTVPYAQGLILFYWNFYRNIWAIPTSGINWTDGIAAVLITPFLFVAVLPALVPVLGLWRRIDNFRPKILLYWLCGWALLLSELHQRNIFHVVFGSPLLIILCIHFLGEFRAKIGEIPLQILAISGVWLASFNLLVVLTAHPVMTRVGSVAMLKDDSVLTFLDDHIAPGTEIFAYPACATYYFLSDTVNPTRYSLLIYDYNTASQFQEVIGTLDQHKVKYVVWNTNLEVKGVDFSIFRAVKHMHPSDFIIEPYLESHYKIIWAKEGIRIMERKSVGDAK